MWKVKVKLFSHVRLFTTPWTAAHQASPFMGFSRQEYWTGVPLTTEAINPGWWSYICLWAFIYFDAVLPKSLSVLRGLGPLRHFLLFRSAAFILSILDFSQSGRRVQVRWLWLIQPNLGWSGFKVIFTLLKPTFILNILILSWGHKSLKNLESGK